MSGFAPVLSGFAPAPTSPTPCLWLMPDAVLLRQDFHFQRVVAWEVFFGEGVDFFEGD
jgi:hypothetical protein